MSDRNAIQEQQTSLLRQLLSEVASGNPFYRDRIEAAGIDPSAVTLESFTVKMPLTTRDEWTADQLAHPPFGTNLTYPVDRYVRFCRTSGSTGKAMTWLDTRGGWDAMLDSWARVYEAAGVREPHRVFFAFSFGPFLGLWTAYDAAVKLGHLCIPGGGLSSVARLNLMMDTEAEVLCCTPTYAIRLAQVAEENGIDLKKSAIKAIIVAGEPGGSIPSTRELISRSWNGARVYDHHGMTEVGPVTYECPAEPGVLHVMEDAFFAEILEEELVLTTLKRPGSPLLRYRTGDVVSADRRSPCACGSHELCLLGGILGRKDDMVVVRGMNVFPSAVEGVVRAIEGVEEYRVEVSSVDGLAEMKILIESRDGDAVKGVLEDKLQAALFLRIPVERVESGSLPRFEMKAARWIRNEGEASA
jgi:phenylacetate-CoA ligase